jgi:ketosteroid isomerase-like protein
MMMSGRAQTAIDRIAEAYLDDSVALDPVAATRAGIPGHDHRLPDLHPAWHEECSHNCADLDVLRSAVLDIGRPTGDRA